MPRSLRVRSPVGCRILRQHGRPGSQGRAGNERYPSPPPWITRSSGPRGFDSAAPRFALSEVDDGFAFRPARLVIEQGDMWRHVGLSGHTRPRAAPAASSTGSGGGSSAPGVASPAVPSSRAGAVAISCTAATLPPSSGPEPRPSRQTGERAGRRSPTPGRHPLDRHSSIWSPTPPDDCSAAVPDHATECGPLRTLRYNREKSIDNTTNRRYYNSEFVATF